MPVENKRTGLVCKITVAALFLIAGCIYVTTFRSEEKFQNFPLAREGVVAVEELEPIITPLLVNLNTAEADELQLLPGIGQKKAALIVEYRTEQGRFKSNEDIMLVPGIKEGTYSKIKDYIYVEEDKDVQEDTGSR